MSNAVSLPSTGFLIEPASWRDLNALRHLEKVCFPIDYWPLLDLIGILTFPNLIRLKAVIEGEMVGFIAADTRAPVNLGWITTIGVLPQHRGRGIGSALLQACEESLNVKKVRLNVRVSNQDAIRLYRYRGYQEVTIWAGYYQDGEDALVLEK
jgi:ribosomal-protein-alanine N-acetyltransferase